MKLRCTIMRGGTSKGIFLRREDLPVDRAERDRIILALFGSPNRRQIDGLGGADPLTSKVAIIGVPSASAADIDYTFGQVSIDAARIDYAGYCGNILAGVAAYAVNEGYVATDRAVARVRIHVTNVGRVIVADVPVSSGGAAETGDLAIAGVPGTGAAIRLDFSATVGSVTGRLLPSGRPTDSVHIPGVGDIEISLVDAGNPMVFARAEAFGLEGSEGPDDVDTQAALIDALELLRVRVASQFHIAGPDSAPSENIPLVALVAPALEYVAYGTTARVATSSMDFASREFFCGRLHKAYGVGETVCTAAAALIPGTIVGRLVGESVRRSGRIRIGHPSGVIEAWTHAEPGETGQDVVIHRIEVERTARRLMDGFAYLADNVATAERHGAGIAVTRTG